MSCELQAPAIGNTKPQTPNPKPKPQATHQKKSPSVETERPLTIACHMKIFDHCILGCKRTGKRVQVLNYLLLTESFRAFAVESIIFLVESAEALTESFMADLVESMAETVESFAESPAPLLQAAITPATARIANTFFMFCMLFL